MARDYYETTIALPDPAAGNALKPLSGVRVSVVPRGGDPSGTLIDVYPADTGVTKGPDPKAGASGTIPFVTGASGSVRFWAEGPAELDVVFEDTQTPARLSDRVGWNAVPAKAGSLSTSMLATDGGIKQAHLAAEVVYQQVPIGGVMEWWRPQQSVPTPPGFEVADGRSVTHEFPGVAGNVTLPNLQNVFILGATAAKADGTGAGNDNLPENGPGIRGTGGSNAPKNFTHAHAVPGIDHTHGPGSMYTGSHGHSVSASGQTGDNSRNAGTKQAGGSGEGLAYSAHSHASSVAGSAAGVGNIGVYGATSGVDRPIGTATNSLVWNADPGTEFRPYFIGLLRLIKVRRS